MTDVKEIALQGSTSCALTRSNEVWCWGNNEKGQVGNGTRTPQLSPELILSDVARLDLGDVAFCAETIGGEVWCWGEHRFAMLITGYEPSVYTPSPVTLD